ncbi:ABC transporter ATP-binding protein [Gordonia zhaorongruii]|uniref:ABC transporter ATP-binding protein n=1 Tax=Gordonia zhaorongruii TaxID=2597659 RepID=UPI00104B3FEC|nr:ATP-binding cassette domain-containing protein [Gordonia zhaorongruii]
MGRHSTSTIERDAAAAHPHHGNAITTELPPVRDASAPESAPAGAHIAPDRRRSNDALVLRGVTKTFTSGMFGRGRTHVAVDNLDLTVPAGSIHAVLGPNGAGKTTTVSMVATLLAPDAGEILIDGVDVVRAPSAVRGLIGVSGQYAAVDGTLSGFENLRLVAQLYGMPRREASVQAREMIEELDLTAAADRPMRTYSGGMRRRLDLAGAIINRPKLVILDEPTTGLDPRGRRQIWDAIAELTDGGTTILLTTQYLEEADELADDITVIYNGAVHAHGTPESLKHEFGNAELTVEVARTGALRHAVEVMTELAELGSGHPEQIDDVRFRVPVDAGTRSTVAAVKSLHAAGVDVVDAAVTAPTLESVFLTLTEPDDVR